MNGPSHLSTRDAAEQLRHRAVEFDLRSLNTEARTIDAVLSTDAWVDVGFGEQERLVHDPLAVDLSRATRGLPLLWSHRPDIPLGRVRNLRFDGGRFLGTVHFDTDVESERRWAQVQAGTLTDVSLGYKVLERVPDGAHRTLARRWRPYEVSVLTMGADTGTGLGMRDEPSARDTPQPTPVVDMRARQIAEVFKPFAASHGELLARCIADPEMTVTAAQAELLRAVATDPRTLPTGSAGAYPAGDDQADKFARAMDEWATLKFRQRPELEHRVRGHAFVKPLDDEQAMVRDELEDRYKAARAARGQNPYIGLPVIEMGRRWLVDVLGDTRAAGYSRSRVADELIKRAGISGHTPSDFTLLLADNMGKQLQVGYVEAPETWQMWCGTGSLADFKVANRPVMSTFGDLDVITGDQEYQHGTFAERQETIALATRGKMFSISRTALINDDQNAFSAIPRHMGRAANRAVGDVVYGLLIANAALSDSIALFHGSHANFVDNGSGAAPSVTTLNAALAAFAIQTDPAGNVIAVRPEYLLHPWALWGTVKTLLASQHTGTNTEENIWQGELMMVPEARLDADDVAAWYLAASPRSIGTVEVAFLDGQQTPFLDQREGWSRDGLEFKVRHDFGAAVLDHRGLYFNDGN
jgi:HK97 family phage prohead protease